MSTSDERFDEVKSNHINALLNERDDISRARTAVDVAAIQLNVATAAKIFFETAANRLTATSAQVETAFQAAVSANRAVAKAREEAEEIPRLLGRLTEATKAAGNLVKTATGTG